MTLETDDLMDGNKKKKDCAVAKQKHLSLSINLECSSEISFESINFNIISGDTKTEILCVSLSKGLRIFVNPGPGVHLLIESIHGPVTYKIMHFKCVKTDQYIHIPFVKVSTNYFSFILYIYIFSWLHTQYFCCTVNLVENKTYCCCSFYIIFCQ